MPQTLGSASMAPNDRRRMPVDRKGKTHKVIIHDVTTGQTQEGYITANINEDGTLGEIFLTDFGKDGSTLQGWVQVSAMLASICIQHGEFPTLVRKLGQMKYPPYGPTDNPTIPSCTSVPDYIIHWLVHAFGTPEQWKELVAEDRKAAGLA